jgi:2-(1,2-epoxy-1,2-dihydrophenyl)acetyl-CoA isomerase
MKSESSIAQRVAVRRDDGVVTLTMDAKGRPTCIDIEMCNALHAALEQITPGQGDRAVLLQSTGSVFCAGGDLFAIEKMLPDPQALLAPLIDGFHKVILALRALPLPVIAAVHGAAAGAGFSLAMACDVVVISQSGRFVAGYPKIGTSSDGGLTFELARRLGRAGAMEAFLLSDAIDAQMAKALGIAQVVASDGEFAQQAFAVAQRLARQPEAAVREIKSLVSAATDGDLARHLEHEKAAFLRCANTAEFASLVGSFTRRAAADVAQPRP